MSDDNAVPIPYLLDPDGAGFADIGGISEALDRLSDVERVHFRNENATAIAQADVDRLLIVAGPGSGKSTLFISRIEHLLSLYDDQNIYVTTFVKKLVADLETDLGKLNAANRSRVDVSTLHTLARSIIEHGNGTASTPMRDHVRIIDEYWAAITWNDVLAFHGEFNSDDYPLENMEDQLHKANLDSGLEWPAVFSRYRQICQFYNAVGFAYLITLATETTVERPGVVGHRLWIIDEYQDFNRAEDALISAATSDGLNVLLTGDDEQAIYQSLKASSPDIIIEYYNDQAFANAMLPFCGRCSRNICRAASGFISAHKPETSLAKVFLPLYLEPDAEKVRIVGTATATGVVDYIRQFLLNSADEYQAYLQRRADGLDSDPFLLVLSLVGTLTLGKSSKEDLELIALINEYAEPTSKHSSSYAKVASYYAAGRYPGDNFSVRKILDYEGLSIDEVHVAIERSIDKGCSLHDTIAESHPNIVGVLDQVVTMVEHLNATGDGVEPLAALLNIPNPDDLLAELLEHPIGVTIREEEDEEAIEKTGNVIPPVALMTMAGSKGLSSHHVIIVGCDDVNMAYATPLVFFVALTRARESLHIIASRNTGGSTSPHSFVYDLPEESCEYFSYKKGGHLLTQLDSKTGLADEFRRLAAGVAYGKKVAAAKRSAEQR